MKKTIFVLFLCSSLFCAAQKSEKLVVHFKFNKYDLDTASKNNLDTSLKNREIIEIQIDAHCDSIGSNEYNDALSLKRASEVKKYLVSKNINEQLIKIKASGKRIPLNKNETEDARALNRRAEIFLIVKNEEPVVKPVEIVQDTVKVNEDSSAISNPVYKDEKPKDIKDLNIDSIEVGSKFTLSNLNFVGGQHHLLLQSKKTLELLVSILKENPTLKIEIQGYVCCTPDNSDGLDWETGVYNLSDNRARTVYDYLVKNGIDRKRLYAIGYGGSHKLVVEKTEADREMNRRVEIKILKK